ncbi:MAG: hypothetical protein IJH53_09535 [Oscillospiraceae bacterium]|nr:hypothetical protein [Oscillospiraceae bacterium]
MVYFRYILLAFVLTGLMLFAGQKIKRWPFVPAITLSIIGSVMFFAGILNCMEFAVILICVAGAFSFIQVVSKFFKNKESIRIRRDYVYSAIFAVAVMYLCYFCYHGVYADGDTLTHWGVVIREMIETGRMPNFSTTEVAYQSYPTGTAGLVFFFCRVAGYSEGVTLFAQALLVFSLLFCLYGMIESNELIPMIIVSGFVLWALHFNVRLDDLKVDNILPLLAIASMIILIKYRNELEIGIIFSCPVMGMIAITKNSGIIFLIFVYICEIVLLIQNRKRTEWIQAAKLSFSVPVGMIFLWNRHIDLVFDNAGETRHSISIAAMRKIYEAKGREEIEQIIENYFRKWFLLEGNTTIEWLALLMCIGTFILGFFLERRLNKKTGSHLKPVLLIVFAYFIYKFSLLGMYVFNMPDSDAVILGAYARYVNSMVIILVCATMLEWIRIIQMFKDRKSAHSIVAQLGIACLLFFCITAPSSIYDLSRPDYATGGCYRNIKRIQKENSIPDHDAHVLVYTYTPYSQFFVSYCFRSMDAWSVDQDSFRRSCIQTPDYYNYLIILNHDEDIDKALEECNYPTDQEIVFLNYKQNLLISNNQ